MQSLRELYRVGRGPSSSHTMGPEAAARLFLEENPGADRFQVTLCGSLASTSGGHQTDRAVLEVLGAARTQLLLNPEQAELPHPNTLDFVAFTDGRETARMRALSVGGGAIRVLGRPEIAPPEVYPDNSFAAIADCCHARGLRLWQYAERYEGPELWDFLRDIWKKMKVAVR